MIDFDPDFQRTSRVWKGTEQAFLIDSILNGFDIPKLYVVDFTTQDVPELNPHHKAYAIIDGKQRLTAVFAFMKDKFPLARQFVLYSDPTLKLGGRKFSELKKLHRPSATAIEKYVLDVKAVVTDEREKVNAVFLRLNKTSKALNGAEVRNALIGEAVEAIRGLSRHTLFTTRVRFATNRSQEKNAAAKVLMLEYEGGAPVDTKKRQLDTFVVSIGDKGGSRFNRTLARVQSNLDALANVFQKNDALLTAQGNVPLYYLFVSRLNAADRRNVRQFLEWFENARRKNRNVQESDRDLNLYDTANRSTNDSGSYKTRLRIIRKKHVEWTRAQAKQSNLARSRTKKR